MGRGTKTELPRGKRIPRRILSIPRVWVRPRHGLTWFVRSSREELTGGRRVPSQKTSSLLGITVGGACRCAGSTRAVCLQTIREIPIPLPFPFHLQSSTFKLHRHRSPPIIDHADLVYSLMNLQEAHEFFHDGDNSSSSDSTISSPSVHIRPPATTNIALTTPPSDRTVQVPPANPPLYPMFRKR